jgi:hypothetical protein
MGNIVLKDAVKRKPGYLYYVDGEGSVCESKMGWNKDKKQKQKE